MKKNKKEQRIYVICHAYSGLAWDAEAYTNFKVAAKRNTELRKGMNSEKEDIKIFEVIINKRYD